MTFKEARLQLLDIGSQDQGSDFEDMVNAGINRVYRAVLAEIGQEFQDRTFTLATRASVSKYGCPLYVKRILNIIDTANTRYLDEMFTGDYDKLYPGTADSGTPNQYYQLGNYGVQRQPATALALSVTSSSTADVTHFFLRATGYVSSTLRTEQITLNGTTAVPSSLTYDANSLERLVKSEDDGYTIAGNITVTDGTNTLSIIPTWVRSPSYLWIEFYPIPSAVLTYTIRASSYKPDLVNDSDWPEFDEDYHDLLVHGTGAELMGVVGKQDLADRMAAKYLERIKRFKGSRQRKSNLDRQFKDIGTTGQLPRRPLIRNIDYV